MPLRPHDIRHKQFRRSLRGFDEQEVTEYMNSLARRLEDLVKDNANLRDRVEEYAGRMEQYTRMEEALHNALLVAQETAAEVKSNAEREAKLIRQAAEQEAAVIRQAAQRELKAAEAAHEAMLERYRALRAQIRGHLLSHLELLDEAEGRFEAALPLVQAAANQVGQALAEAAPAAQASEAAPGPELTPGPVAEGEAEPAAGQAP